MNYVPNAFRIKDLTTQHELIAANSFGLLITETPDGPGLSHIPFLLDRERGSMGHLRCHVAMANKIWRGIADKPVTAVFSGPHAYISPDWYANPDLVPTWNYTAAYVTGTVAIMDDSALEGFLWVLSDREEGRITGKKPWTMDRVDADALAQMRKAIVGIDIEITRIDGKAKMSQNREADDRDGVVRNLRDLGTPDALAVANLVDTIDG
ncbi:MAG: FMN-binding negative transcriptional regulator [Alphaproteobacteria bacterium]|jgi:transcriptional regulator|nr:FMN-binding negative transcriptional regulator [Alphaproteobacteria bacterium]